MLYATTMSSVGAPYRLTVKSASFGPKLVKAWPLIGGQLVQAGRRLVGPNQVHALLPATAIGSVATMLTTSGRFVRGGVAGRIVMLTGEEVAETPRLSVA